MKRIFFNALLCFLMFLNMGVIASAQTSVSNENQTLQANAPKVEGTYQIQVINSRNQPYIPANIEEQVLKNRQEKEIKYISLGTEVRLMILPLSTIKSADFKPLERIAYIKE